MKKIGRRPALCLGLAVLLFASAFLGGCGSLGRITGGGSRLIGIDRSEDAGDPADTENGSSGPSGGHSENGGGSQSGSGGSGATAPDAADLGDSAFAAAAADASFLTNECHPDSYVMDVTLDTGAHTISGTCDIALTNLSGERIGYIDLRLYSGAITDGSYITDVENADTGRSYDFMPDVDGSLYAVRLQDDGMEPGSSMTLRVTFVSEIPEIDDRFGYHEDDVLTMYCLSFCFPQVSLYHDGAWDEDPYYDDGETEVNVMTDYTVTLHAPADLTVAASGHQTTENGVTRIEAPNVREIGIVCCDHMTVYSEEINGVTFNQYCPSYEGLLRFYDNMLANTEAAVEVYTEYIGPYIYDEIDIVPVHLGSCGSGMEMPGLIMNGLPVFFYPDRGNGQPVFSELSYVDSAITTAHETAHQWFYCAVGDDQYDEAWLDESFASFVSEYLYVLEWPDAMDRAVQLDDEEGLDPYTYLVDRADPYSDVVNQMRYMQGMTATPYINWPVSDYPNDYDYTICVYYYGEYFLAELQHAMGDEMFYRMMRDYYADASGQISRGGCFVRCVLSYDHSDEVLDVLERYVDPSALR